MILSLEDSRPEINVAVVLEGGMRLDIEIGSEVEAKSIGSIRI